MAEALAASLQAALADLAKWLGETHIPSMIIGGVAASVLGRPRLTQDIDALAILPEDEWSGAMASAARFGIVPRIGTAMGMSDILEEFDKVLAQCGQKGFRPSAE